MELVRGGRCNWPTSGPQVIKIEDPTVGGDVSRYVPPYQEGESSLFFETFNRGKRSMSLDLRHPQARPVFEDLVRSVDVVFSNLRGDQPDKLGLRFADLEAVNPRIVCCSLSGFGSDGPRRGEGAYDYTLQGLAGWQSITGEPDGPPTKSGPSLVDFCGGYVAALAILAGVGVPAATAAAATPTCRCSRWRSRSSPTSARGSPRAITSRCAAAVRHTSRSCPSRTSGPPTAGW